jgi:hypothetical protein
VERQAHLQYVPVAGIGARSMQLCMEVGRKSTQHLLEYGVVQIGSQPVMTELKPALLASAGNERGRGRGRRGKGRRGRGRFEEDDSHVMTLEEWEARKAAPSSSPRSQQVRAEHLKWTDVACGTIHKRN